MTAAFKDKENQVKEVNAKAEKLQIAMTDVVSQVETLESEREEMKQAVEAIKAVAVTDEMKVLKTGQLVVSSPEQSSFVLLPLLVIHSSVLTDCLWDQGKMAAKLAARVHKPKEDLDAQAQVRREAQAAVNEIFKITTLASSISVVRSGFKLMRKLKASIAVTKAVGGMAAPQRAAAKSRGDDEDNPEDTRIRMEGAAGMFGGVFGGGDAPLGYSNEELNDPDFDVDAAYALSFPDGTEAPEVDFDYGIDGVNLSSTRLARKQAAFACARERQRERATERGEQFEILTDCL